MSTVYPAAIDVYLELVDGETIFAVHVNDPRDAITAIETELGTNPKGTFSDLKDRVRLWGARVRRTTNQSISSGGSGDLITFDAQRYDTDDFWDAGSPTKLTCPKDGVYHIGASIYMATGTFSTTEQVQVSIKLNGTTTIAAHIRAMTNGLNESFPLSCDYELAEGDYVEVEVFQNSGSSKNVLVSGAMSPEFWMHLVGVAE